MWFRRLLRRPDITGLLRLLRRPVIITAVPALVLSDLAGTDLADMAPGDTALVMVLADTGLPTGLPMGLPMALADTVLVPGDMVPMRLPISPCPAPPAAAAMAGTAAAIAAVIAVAVMADTEAMADTKSPVPQLAPV